MREKTFQRYALMRAFWTIKWLIVLLVALFLLFQFIAPANSTPRLALYKLMLGICGAIVGHIVVKALYPYISLSTMLEEDKLNETPDAIKFAGACILRGAVMGALIVGILLGV